MARSTRGMVASPHALATAAGVDVLRRGGNAVDAAIATNALLAVVYPAMCGLGGDAFWLVYEPRTATVAAYNGSGRAPRGASAAALRAAGVAQIPWRSAHSVTVPGAVRSWHDVATAHGSQSLAELLEPAERVARNGFACTDVMAGYFALPDNEAALAANSEARRVFLARGTPRAGGVIRNPELAATIASLRRENGVADFYSGAFAEAAVRTLRRGGSSMTVDDFASHRTERTEPLTLDWRGLTLVAHGPNSQGMMTLVALGMLEGDAACEEFRWQHLAIEALKRAFRERDAAFGDPDFVDVPVATLLSREWLERARAEVTERAASVASRAATGDTVAICVVDDEGRAVSLIQSLYMNFGSAIVAEGTGVILHNRGAYFRLDPGHPNEFAGAKRPLHTLSPGIALRDGRPAIVYGTMGSDGQPQNHVQILHNVVERGMNVQEAIDAPRWLYGRSNVDETTDALRIENRASPELTAALAARGHDLIEVEAFDNVMGHAHAIVVDDETGTLAGGSDPRADSTALGL